MKLNTEITYEYPRAVKAESTHTQDSRDIIIYVIFARAKAIDFARSLLNIIENRNTIWVWPDLKLATNGTVDLVYVMHTHEGIILHSLRHTLHTDAKRKPLVT